MEYEYEYYFMKNKEWYYYDTDSGMLKLTQDAPEKAKKSYEWFLKDEEHSKKLMYGLISDEEDDAYIKMREKIELEFNNDETNKDLEEVQAKKLFGV